MTDRELECVRENARGATTEDLLDRVTAYRAGMEPDALAVIEEELAGRGIGPAQVWAYVKEHGANVLVDENGVALMCSYCDRPAIFVQLEPDLQVMLMSLLCGQASLVTGYRRYCADHRPAPPAEPQT